MDIIEVIKRRRSVREYKDREISKDILTNIIDAARFAPTARGVQPWEFIVITEPAVLKKIADITVENGKFISKAKSCIVVYCSDTKYYLEDGCAAVENMLIAAAAFGVASCWVAGDKKPYCGQISELLGVPAGFKLVSLIALGYPKSEDGLRIIEKRGLDKIIHWDKF